VSTMELMVIVMAVTVPSVPRRLHYVAGT
jgi:hypothetical protein